MSTNLVFLIFIVQIWTLQAQLIPTPNAGVYQVTEPIDHSECPHWDTRNNVLYFVDIHKGGIYRFDYFKGILNHINLDGELAPVIPSTQDPNLLIVGLNKSVAAVEWDGVSDPSETRILDTLATQFPTSRVNEGKADKEGRLWIGTMGTGSDDDGNLFLVTCATLDTPAVEITPVNISNGLTWNAANDRFYYIDSPTGQVVEFAYDDETGDISDKRVVFDMADHTDLLIGDPDGMTIDEDDNLWIALYGGGAVINVNSTSGELIRHVPIPAQDITSVMWGGPDLDMLFVTTSRVDLSPEQRRQQPGAGSVFVILGLATRGVPTFTVDLLASIDDAACGDANKK